MGARILDIPNIGRVYGIGKRHSVKEVVVKLRGGGHNYILNTGCLNKN